MPSEVRHLMFRPTEVIQAVTRHLLRSGRQLGAGHISSCTASGGEAGQAVSVQLRIHLDAGDDEKVTVDDATLLAALISYCRQKGVPLSSKAMKSVQLMGDQVCLVSRLA